MMGAEAVCWGPALPGMAAWGWLGGQLKLGGLGGRAAPEVDVLLVSWLGAPVPWGRAWGGLWV